METISMTTSIDRLNPKLRERIENFCIYLGVDPKDFVKIGMQNALGQFSSFVDDLPKKYLEPTNFFKLLMHNFDFVYGLVEAVGSDVAAKNAELDERINELQGLFDTVHDQHMLNLSRVSKYHHTERWLIDSNEDADIMMIEADDSDFGDDVPMWKITIFLGDDDRMSTTCDHFEMSKYFRDAVKVMHDPHPEYDGIDALDIPRDDMVSIIEDDGSSDFDDGVDDDPGASSANEWHEDENPM